MKSINIIGDIAGRFDELMLLLQKMPPADLILAVGDLIDRGPKSKEVIQWFIDNTDKADSLYGNHEDMMVSNSPWWLHNGGAETLKSYNYQIPSSHIEWISKRPLYCKADGLIVTHAPITQIAQLPKKILACDNRWLGYEGSFIWARTKPVKPLRSYFFVHGHNSRMREYVYGCKNNVFGVCIDNSSLKELCGLHWTGQNNEYKIYSQQYLDTKEIRTGEQSES